MLSRPLYLYRFHSAECVVHTIKPKIPAGKKKFYDACDCPLWITGTDASGAFVPRQSTKFRDRKSAEAYLRAFNSQAANELQEANTIGPTLEDCTQRFLDKHKEGISPKVYNAHKLCLDRLKTYAATKGVTMANELTIDLLENFVTYGLTMYSKGTAKQTAVAKLKVFLKRAFKRGWIKENLAARMEAVAAEHEEKQPYTVDEVTCILENALALKAGNNGVGYGSQPATFRLLLELMLETGLRVSDAVRFEPSKCVLTETGTYKYTLKPKKQTRVKLKKTCAVYLKAKLKQDIDECEWMSNKYPLAYAPISEDDDTNERAVYERMQSIGKRCDIDNCRPHRFRDTFAVRRLEKGWSMDDVSKALCHGNIAVTEKFYAAWSTGRDNRLERLTGDFLNG